MEKKQSAVDWLISQIAEDQTIMVKSLREWLKIFEQAKKMEKEQIVEIVEKSRETGLTAEYLILSLYGGENE